MKRLWILAVASAVLLTGCASEQAKTGGGAAAGGAPEADVNSVPAITEIAIEDIAVEEGETQPPEKLTAPPDIMICTTTEMIASAAIMTKGTYSWSYEEDDGMMADVEACCDIPSSFKNVTAVFDPGELTEAPKLQLSEGARIVKVECWNGTATQSVGFTEDGEIMFPVEPIGNTYCVTIEFSEGWGSYGEQGVCDYVFRTTDNVSDNTVADSGNSTESVPPSEPQTSAGYAPEEPVEHAGNIAGEPIQYTQEPPELSLCVFFWYSDESLEIELPINSFTWTYIDDNGNAMTLCADTPAPHQMSIEPDFDIMDAAKARAELTNDGRLIGVTNWSADGEALEVKFEETGEIYFPDCPIGEMYSVSVEYPEGKCQYVFAASCEGLWECGTPWEEALQGALAPIAPEYDLENLYKPDGRISRVTWDERLAPTATIRSLDELKAYYTANLANEWTTFEDCFQEYDGAFFEKNVLVISYFDEGSGSVKHEYLGIDNDNGCIVVRRTTPEVGTCDMAAYVLTVEIPADKALESYTCVFDNIYEWE